MTDTTGCCGPGIVWTPSGHLLDVMNPDPALISIVDIAYNLSRIPRWNGSTMGPVYSVAQHSCMVCDGVVAKHSKEPALKALLHDAHEYLLGDMARPLKLLMGQNSEYTAACTALQSAIERKFGVVDVCYLVEKWIKERDSAAARGEAATMLKSMGEGVVWGNGVMTPEPQWTSQRAMYEFLWRFEKYHKPKVDAVVVNTEGMEW